MAPSAEAVQTFPPRNPRRRQRKDMEEGGSLRQQPLRKRSRLDGEDATSEIVTNGNGVGLNHEANGRASIDLEDSASPHSLDIPIRGRHRTAKHIAKEDGCTTWTKNYVYDVKQLPGFPKQLRVKDIEYRATINPNSGYALAVTHEQILVWNYTSTTQWPEPHVFKLSSAARTGDPLPYAAFVTATSNSDTGLVVINSTNGNITYWENIEDADALSLFEQRRNGIEGSCGTLLYGEFVTNFENIDHAGFLLSFSSARAAQLLVRDTQSKPCINVNFLRGAKSGSSSGFLSGLKNVFGGGGLMKDIVATKALASKTRGEMDVILSSTEALFQFWRLTWSGQASFVTEIDALAVTQLVLQSSFGPDGSTTASQEIKVLDFATRTRSHHGDASDFPCDLLVLVSATSTGSVRYALVELELREAVATVIRTLPLHTYAPEFVDKREKKAQLCLPKNSGMAYVVFEEAVVIASLARMELTINTQVLQDSGKLPEPFQDSFYFQPDHNHAIVDQAAENAYERSRHSSIILFVRDCGLMRVGATDVPSRDLETRQENSLSRLSAKAKIEQAIFFGTISNNPLDLSKKSTNIFSSSEIEEAAMEISEEVLATESPFLPRVAPNMEQHLEQRARVLDQLARHLKDTYPSISRPAKWKLLANAEKLAAARSIWSIYDKALEGRGVQQLLPKILFLLHQDYKIAPENETEGFDQVRFWFLKSLKNMPIIMPWTYHAIANMNEHGEVGGPVELFDLTSDANDILLAGLETAFAFRMEKAELYGLLNEKLEDGVLRTGYEGLQEFWTSIYQTLAKTQGMFKNCRQITKDFVAQAGEEGYPTEEKLMKVAADTPRLVELCCKIYEERARWYLEQQDEKAKQSGQNLWQTYERVRYEFITQLSEMGLAQFGMIIAEKHHDLQALVFLVMEEAEYAVTMSSSRQFPREKEKMSEMIQLMETRIRNYFKTYGDEWGDALYSAHLVRDCYTMLLDQSRSYKDEVTRFLRADPKRGKLSWINDVLSEKSFTRAGTTLLDVAVNQEQDVWSKKVELSLAKLALAASDEIPPDSKLARHNRDMQANAMKLVKIQEKLYDHMRPVLYNAMDNAAELQLAMESYGRLSTSGRNSLQQLLERDMERLLVHSTLTPEQLIDILTLMDQKVCELKQDDIAGQEFFLALQVLSSSSLELGSDTCKKLLRTIWRRCFIRDDWRAFQEAAYQSDEQFMVILSTTILFRTFYEGYAHSIWNGNSVVTVMEPSSIVGMGTSVEDISDRFPSADISEPLARDLQDEDQTLRYLIEHCRLEHWVSIARDHAQACLAEEATAAAAQAKKTKRVKDQLRSEYKDLDSSSEDDEDEDEDGEGEQAKKV